MARMAGTEPEASNSTDLVSNNKEVTVSPSKFKKWRTGVKLEARSTEGNDQWFLAKIQEIDKVNHRVLIHYIHWNSRHDEWVSVNSERLRPLRSNRLNGSLNGSFSPSTVQNNSPDLNLPKDLKSGDRVMATWKLNRKYPAIVIGFEHDSGSYLVEFFDGVQSKVKPTQLRRLRKDEESLGGALNGEGVESETEQETICETLVEPTPSPKGRRERKRKFDVKALLKMRSGLNSSPLSPPLSTTTERTATPSPTPPSPIPEIIPTVNKKGGGRRSEKFGAKTAVNDQKEIKVEVHIDKPKRKNNQKNQEKILTPKVKTFEKEVKKKISDKSKDKKSSLSDKPPRSKAALKDQPIAKSKAKQMNGKTSDNFISTKKKPSTIQETQKRTSKSKSVVQSKISLSENGESQLNESENLAPKKEKRTKRTKEGENKESENPQVKISKKRKRQHNETLTEEDVRLEVSLSTSSEELVSPKDDTTNGKELLSGKRERKKKKFWDDEDPEQLNFKQRPRSNSKSSSGQTLSSNRSRRQSKIAEFEVTTPAISQVEEEPSVPSANGRPLRYLAFDLLSDPKQIADKMVEGFNIPGPGEPIPIDSSKLPKGWTKLVVQRGIGITKGKWDVFVQNSSGRSFRSKTELQRHLDEIKSSHTAEEFEFSLDDRLKKLRQIWKQHIVNSTSDTANCGNARKSSQYTVATDVPSTKVQDKNRTNQVANPKNRKSDSEVPSEPVVLHLPSISVESETGQGLRCSIEKCGKLFRNDRLLQQHVKHYHPDVFDQVIASVNSPISSACSPSENVSIQSSAGFEHSGPLSPFSQPQITNSERRRCATLNDLDLDEAEFTPGLKKRKSSLLVDLEAASLTSKKKHRGQEFLKKGSGPGRPGNKRYFSEGSATSPTNNNSVSEKELTNFEMVQSGGRIRTESVFSVESSMVGPSEDGDLPLASLKRHHPKNLPPTPPTFRLSKRREAQLVGSNKRLSRRRPFFPLLSRDDDSGLASPEILTPISGYHLPVAPGSTSYPASEMDTSVTSEHLTSEEVVHCSCQRREEDGLMIQCDICLCWQHGICLGVEDEDKVPEKYICDTCRNPRRGRTSSRFTFDHDWLKEGKLPASRVEAEDDDAFKILSDLMADLSNLSKDLHAIRLKLQVASQPNNPKVFMWSNVWDPPTSIQTDNLPTQSPTDALTVETLTSFDVDESKSGHLDSQAVIEKLKFHLGNGEKTNVIDQVFEENLSCNGIQEGLIPNGDEVSFTEPTDVGMKEWNGESFDQEISDPVCAEPKQNDKESSIVSAPDTSNPFEKLKSCRPDGVSLSPSNLPEAKIVNGEPDDSKDFSRLNGSEKTEETDVELPPKKSSEESFVRGEIQSNLEVDQLDGGADQHFDPTLIPTLSEVAQLLPGVLEAIGSESDTVVSTDLTSTFQSITQPLVGSILPRDTLFEQKRLDRDECRLNLLEHVTNLQNEVSARLSVIDSALLCIETGVAEIPTTRSGLASLLRDIDATRQLIWSI